MESTTTQATKLLPHGNKEQKIHFFLLKTSEYLNLEQYFLFLKENTVLATQKTSISYHEPSSMENSGYSRGIILQIVFIQNVKSSLFYF